MTPAAIIKEAMADGVNLALSPAGTIKAAGEGSAVNRWLPLIREEKAGILVALQQAVTPAPKVGTGDTATASRWWLIHDPDREPLEVACYPPATHAEILAGRPDAIAAEPFEPILRRPTAPLAADDETAIREWLADIEETDPTIIADVLNQCRTDSDARGYFVGRTRKSSSFKECAA